MDRRTIDVYDWQAATYEATRPPRFTDRSAALAASTTGPVLDAGCGNGAYLGALGERVVGLDASRSMLELAAAHGRPLVRADLGRLPFRPRSLGATWARNSYLHVAHDDLPFALAELHRALPVGARVAVSVISGPDDVVESDDDLPGRRFWRWSDRSLVDAFAGAGFADVSLSASARASWTPCGPARLPTRSARACGSSCAA